MYCKILTLLTVTFFYHSDNDARVFGSTLRKVDVVTFSLAALLHHSIVSMNVGRHICMGPFVVHLYAVGRRSVIYCVNVDRNVNNNIRGGSLCA